MLNELELAPEKKNQVVLLIERKRIGNVEFHLDKYKESG